MDLKGKGLYILLVDAHGSVAVGKLGQFRFDGKYLYIGSAWGPGGFQRIKRHLATAAGQNRRRRWHIDYLLGRGALLGGWLLPGTKLSECELVSKLIALGARPAVPGFGASDSSCETHLLLAAEPEKLIGELVECGCSIRWEGHAH